MDEPLGALAGSIGLVVSTRADVSRGAHAAHFAYDSPGGTVPLPSAGHKYL